MTFDLRSFLYERSPTYFIIIFIKGNNQATFDTIITPFGWGPFWGLNARSPLACQADKGKSYNYENNANNSIEATVSRSVNSYARHIGPLVNSVHVSVICHFKQPLSSFLHAILPLQTRKIEQPAAKSCSAATTVHRHRRVPTFVPTFYQSMTSSGESNPCRHCGWYKCLRDFILQPLKSLRSKVW